MSDEWFSYIAELYAQIKEWLDFFEHAVRGSSGKLPEIMWDMVVERSTWEQLMMKNHISHTMVAKYQERNGMCCMRREAEGMFFEVRL